MGLAGPFTLAKLLGWTRDVAFTLGCPRTNVSHTQLSSELVLGAAHIQLHKLPSETQSWVWKYGRQMTQLEQALMPSNFWFKSGPDHRHKCSISCPSRAKTSGNGANIKQTGNLLIQRLIWQLMHVSAGHVFANLSLFLLLCLSKEQVGSCYNV